MSRRLTGRLDLLKKRVCRPPPGVTAAAKTSQTGWPTTPKRAVDGRGNGPWLSFEQLREIGEIGDSTFSHRAWLELGKGLSLKERYDEAEEALKHALDWGKIETAPEAGCTLAVDFAHQGRYEDMTAMLNLVWGRYANRRAYLIRLLSRVLVVGRGDTAQAAKVCERIVDEDIGSDDAQEARLRLAEILEGAGDAQGAERVYRAAIQPHTYYGGREKSPRWGEAQLRLSKLLMSRGRRRDATPLLREMLDAPNAQHLYDSEVDAATDLLQQIPNADR